MSTPISFVSQCTIKAPITCRGVGIHSGAEVTLTLNPAPTDHGIVFRRSDLSESMPIPALFPYVVGTRLGTVIGTSEDNSISTIEHLMSALQACGIDNALIDVSGPEVPVMDGSASPFLFLVDCAGIQEQDKPRRYIRIDQKITHKQPEGLTRLSPADDFEITFDIDFDAETIGKQSYTFDGNKQAYKTDIARARTFGFLHEAEQLKAVGLARGANYTTPL
jgi:UDP-3-O-[3-hydroxymyristoyl] N-acetylglucosamine deacetylase